MHAIDNTLRIAQLVFIKTTEWTLDQKERWPLWLPAFFGIGIIYYFSLYSEPDIRLALYSFILATLLVYLLRNYPVITMLLLLFITSLGGFITVYLHAHLQKAPLIAADLGVVWVRADIESIESRPHGHRVILTNLDIWQPDTGRFPAEQTPKRIRLTIRTDLGTAQPGDRIAVKAILKPPPSLPIYPDSYNFSRYAYFKQIGGIGYSISDVTLRHSRKILDEPVELIRHKTGTQIQSALSEQQHISSIATALLTGEKGRIPKEVLEHMRNAGLGHLLAISGLHMVLVMTGFFFLSRAVMAMFSSLALRYNIKKWAASIAVIAGLFYLLLTGMPISAIRAYIMVSFFFLAILIDRTGTPMRPVAWAALVILLFDPSSIMSPSFQMSFAAVIALITAFELLGPRLSAYMRQGGILRRALVYFGSIMLSSLVAGIATAPFALYHFGQFANYGMFANLIAIPLTSLWIMPFGMCALLLMPLGLESIALIPMGWGIALLTELASFFASLADSVTRIPQIRGWTIGIIALGALWLCLWKGKIRLCGVAVIIAGAAFIAIRPVGPDIIVDQKGKLFAVRSKEGQLYFSSFTSARYAREQWLRASGQAEALHFRDAEHDVDLVCNDLHCIYSREDRAAIFVKEVTEDLLGYCHGTYLFINLTSETLPCQNIHTVSLSDLEHGGTHTFWLDETPRMRSAADSSGKRLWTAFHITNKTEP